MFVSGVGGTGKSFLIETIKALVGSMWSGDNTVTCAISAPTGQASFNVGEITTYQLFRLPIEHEGKTAGYWSLPKVSESDEDQPTGSENVHCRRNFHGVQSQSGVHAHETGRTVRWSRVVWIEEHSLCWRYSSTPTCQWECYL